MKRHWVFALAALVAIPRLAHAQSDVGWGPQIRVTPFVGISPGIHQNGIATVTSGTTVTAHPYRVELNSSLPLGVNAEYRVWNRFSVIGEGVWSSRGGGTFVDSITPQQFTRVDGSNFWMAKAAAAMRLRENNPDMQLNRLNGAIFVGPAYIRDKAKVGATTPFVSTVTVSQLGLNMGADAELPLANNRLAFQVGLENYMIFWNNDDYRFRVLGYMQQSNPNVTDVTVDATKTNLWIGRFGLTFRF